MTTPIRTAPDRRPQANTATLYPTYPHVGYGGRQPAAGPHHPNAAVRRYDLAAPARGSRFVRAGEKDSYDLTNPTDLVEYRTVIGYRQH